jgi:hypothetical protein
MKDLLDEIDNRITSMAKSSFHLKFGGWLPIIAKVRGMRSGVTN